MQNDQRYRNNEQAALELMSLLCKRLSHRIRTPLGVVLSVLDELADRPSALPTDREVLSDGRAALEQMIEVARLLDRCSGARTFPLESIPSDAFFGGDLRSVLEEQSISVVFEGSIPVGFIRCDERLLLNGIVAIANYAQTRSNTNDPLVVRLGEFVPTRHWANIAFHIADAAVDNNQSRSGSGTFRQIAETDHSTHTLLLLFAELVVASFAGTTTVTWAGPEITFEASLPLFPSAC